jgi:hypothetical protein
MSSREESVLPVLVVEADMVAVEPGLKLYALSTPLVPLPEIELTGPGQVPDDDPGGTLHFQFDES